MRSLKLLPRATARVVVALICLAAVTAQARGQAEFTDQQIAAAVENRMFIDPTVRATALIVRAEDHAVTIEGTVDSVLARVAAIEVAESVRGVRSVVDDMIVSPTPRDDAAVQTDVSAALETDPVTSRLDIDATVENGTVTLTGAAPSWAHRQLASEVLQAVSGVNAIVNELAVDMPERDDAAIAEDIRHHWLWDAFVDTAQLELSVTDGTVSLAGVVGSAAERSRAARIAMVPGVTAAADVSDVEIDWTRRDSLREPALIEMQGADADEALRQVVGDRLRAHPRTAPFDIGIAVSDGTVTLTGTVDNYLARQAAETVAEDTAKVVAAVNEINVVSAVERPDLEVSRAIRNVYEREADIGPHDVTVSVFRGTVILAGVVDNPYLRRRAEEAAGAVSGVVRIDNDLMIVPTGRRARTEWQIASDIETAMRWDPYLDAEQITLSMDANVATLSGTVARYRDRRIVERIALNAGVERVDNQLEVVGSR